MQYFLPLLAILFIGLKLTGFISWSWIWVLAPILWPILLLIVVLVLWLAVKGVRKILGAA